MPAAYSALLDTPLRPNLTAGQLGAALLQAGLLVLAWLLLRRMRVRCRERLGSTEGNPHRFYAGLLSVCQRLGIWLWIVGIYTLITWHLGPWLGVGQTWSDRVWGAKFLSAVTIIFILSVAGRLIWVTNQRLRGYAADGTHWQALVAALVGDVLQIGVPFAALEAVRPLVNLPPGWNAPASNIVHALGIGAIGWVALRMVNLVATGAARDRGAQSKEGALRMRSRITQVGLLQRMAAILIGFVTAASMLVVFPAVRQLGASLLASAGIVGIVAGVAAQRSLANLFAGFQIAVTQPILIGDQVLVEGEFGDVEEITLTYVVICLWDLRRLVLPISYFLEKPFQNWTRRSAELLGAVMLYVDYRVPLAELRAEFDRVVEASPLWNRQVKGVQVTDSRERCMEVRFLVSADDPGKTFDLRCAVREALIEFLNQTYPQALPARVRTDCEPAPGAPAQPGADHGN